MPGHVLSMLVTLVVFCCVVRSFADRCVAGNCEESTDGTYEYLNGDEYTGGWKRGYWHGQVIRNRVSGTD
jgi:hypothetical protein